MRLVWTLVSFTLTNTSSATASDFGIQDAEEAIWTSFLGSRPCKSPPSRMNTGFSPIPGEALSRENHPIGI